MFACKTLPNLTGWHFHYGIYAPDNGRLFVNSTSSIVFRYFSQSEIDLLLAQKFISPVSHVIHPFRRPLLLRNTSNGDQLLPYLHCFSHISFEQVLFTQNGHLCEQSLTLPSIVQIPHPSPYLFITYFSPFQWIQLPHSPMLFLLPVLLDKVRPSQKCKIFQNPRLEP